MAFGLQVKSGDSYTRKRQSDGAEIFTLKKQRHAEYWMAQAFPVLLVIWNAEGEVRWMEVRDWLKRTSDNGFSTQPSSGLRPPSPTPVGEGQQIVFEGERFAVMRVRRWQEKILSEKTA